MADKVRDDSLKRSVEESKPLTVPLQECGTQQDFDLGLPRQQQDTQAPGEVEDPSAIRKLADSIAIILVFLLNSPPGRMVTSLYNTARTAVGAFQMVREVPKEKVGETDKMKIAGQEIQHQLKEIWHNGRDLEEKISKFRELFFTITVDLTKWEIDLITARDRLAKCGIDIHCLQGFADGVVTEARATVTWTISQLITGLIFAVAVSGTWYYWVYMSTDAEIETTVKVVSLVCLLVVVSLTVAFCKHKAQAFLSYSQLAFECEQVKRDLEESKRSYMKCKVTIEETLPSSKRVVDKYKDVSPDNYLKKLKSE